LIFDSFGFDFSMGLFADADRIKYSSPKIKDKAWFSLPDQIFRRLREGNTERYEIKPKTIPKAEAEDPSQSSASSQLGSPYFVRGGK